MAAKSADPQTIQEIRRLASDPSKVRVGRQANSDLLAWGLTKEDICDKIVEWIDAKERVKPTTLHSYSDFKGEPAYVMKPRIKNMLFYLKVALVELGEPDEYMLLMSTHPDH